MNLQNRLKTTAGRVALLTLAFVLLAGLFYWIVSEDWQRTAVTTDLLSASGLAPLREG